MKCVNETIGIKENYSLLNILLNFAIGVVSSGMSFSSSSDSAETCSSAVVNGANVVVTNSGSQTVIILFLKV